jgi:hypothetical protein
MGQLFCELREETEILKRLLEADVAEERRLA